MAHDEQLVYDRTSAATVSVVIPTRGRPEFVRRAVLSALMQEGVDLEVIVVLDGADSSTERSVGSIDDARVRLLTLATPVGGAEARNIGARAANGRYIALLDDDDEWLPGKLAKQLAVAKACPVENFVVTTQYLYRSDGRADEVWPGHLPAPDEPRSEFLFSSRGGFQTSTYLCPRKLFLAMPFSAGLVKHQDWDWFLQLAALPDFKLLVVAEPLSVYYAPLQIRKSVSGKCDWRFSQAWAQRRLPLMTRRAYSMFLTKICLRGAMKQRESLRGVLFLLREIIARGRPGMMVLAEITVRLLMPESLRSRLRDGREGIRRWAASRYSPGISPRRVQGTPR